MCQWSRGEEKGFSMSDKSKRIAQLNDHFRKTGQGGRIVATQGFGALPEEDQQQIFSLVRMFNNFSQDNDPHGEHDFGAVEYKDERIFWKIDYYDPEMIMHSEDSADPEKTVRVMTIMLASEY